MPEYVYVIGLAFGGIFVVCHIISVTTAHRMCQKTCKMLEKQLEAMEREGL